MSACPQCRNNFEFKDIRPLHLKPSNNSSGSQTSSRHDSASDQDGYIKQAKYIARSLKKLHYNYPAESLINAADVIEQVTTIQCKVAQACPLTECSQCSNISTGNYLESCTSVLDETGL
jgi:hypothetical protein